MSKKVLTLVMAAAFIVGVAGVSLAGKYIKCEVKSVEGSTVTLDCGKKASKVAKWTKVKIKNAKKKAVEGC